jgi:hypothetical protein
MWMVDTVRWTDWICQNSGDGSHYISAIRTLSLACHHILPAQWYSSIGQSLRSLGAEAEAVSLCRAVPRAGGRPCRHDGGTGLHNCAALCRTPAAATATGSASLPPRTTADLPKAQRCLSFVWNYY